MLQEAVQTVAQQPPPVLSFTMGQILGWGFGLLIGVFGLFGGFLTWYAKKAVDKLSSIDNEMKDYKKHVEVTYKQKSECTRTCETPDVAKAIRESIHKESKSLVKLFTDFLKEHKVEFRKAKA